LIVAWTFQNFDTKAATSNRKLVALIDRPLFRDRHISDKLRDFPDGVVK
jgi:hypothetical protein